MGVNRFKTYLAAVIFIGLTLVKLAVPSYAAELREKVMNTIDRNDDITGIIETIGSKISGMFAPEVYETELDKPDEEEVSEVMLKVTPQPITEDEQIPQNTQTAEQSTEPVIEQEQTPEPTPTPEPETISEPSQTPEQVSTEPECVSVFKEKLKEYSGYELPDNVSCDMPEIPFEYTSPVAGYNSSGFGYREHPIDNVIKFHYGTDFAAMSGDEVCAFADGYVYAAGTSDGYGNYLILTHEDGYSTIYGHLSEFIAHEGDMVSKGQVIGLVGSTGKATGPHLHFELLHNDVYINPEYYV